VFAASPPSATPAMPSRGAPSAPVSSSGDSARFRPIAIIEKRNGVRASPLPRIIMIVT